MIISELLPQKSSADIITIAPDRSLAEMSALIAECNIGVLIITDEAGRPHGIVSERDLARAVALFPGDFATRTVGDIMTTGVITCKMNDEVIEILDIMNDRGIRHVPVMENGVMKAVLSIREFNIAYRRLQAQARTDYMTGLTNRRYFMEIFEQEANRRSRFGTPLSLMMLDIDTFKAINDTHGHGVGDSVICALADLLRAECRIYDTIGRMGGEEYAILCPNTDLAGAGTLCNRIMAAVRKKTIAVGSLDLRFTVSFGLYQSTDPDEATHTIIARTDELLYRAKETGRDRIVSGRSAPRDVEGDAAVA